MSAAGPRRLLMIEQGGRGGVADYTGALVAALAARGWKVDLATADDHLYEPVEGVVSHRVFHYVRETTAPGRALLRVGLKRPVNGVLFVLSLPRLTMLARRAEVVHSQGWEIPQLGVLAMLCLRLAGRPIVQTAHSTFERPGRLPRLRRLTREAIAHLVARTIVHTAADVERLAPRAAARAVVIPHGEYGGLARGGGEADREAARAELGIPADAPVTLLFGQLRTDKGLGDLLQALRELPELHLLIGGQDNGALAEQAGALADPALRGRVTIREGFLEMSEAARLFAACDTVALPYRVASASGVLLLAYGFRRAVVVYPVGGMAEAVVDGETGWICARPDPEALVEALAETIRLGAQECLRRGAAGERLAEERFSWPAIAARTEKVYEQVHGGGAERDTIRGARLLLGAGAGAEAAKLREVRHAMRPGGVPPSPVRAVQLLARKLGRLDYERAVAAPLMAARRAALGPAAAGPPRFLVRVDEYPHYLAADEPERFGTDRYERFHETMSAAGVPYLVAVLPQVSSDPLDPAGSGRRDLGAGELEMLARLSAERVSFAMHGRDHRTRHASPRRHSELCGLSAAETEALLDAGLDALADASLRPRVFVPPFNRFDASQYRLLADRFDVICGGPESVGLLGFQRSPLWWNGAVYLPAYHPLYGQADEAREASRRLIDARAALWCPIVLHWGWEAEEDWAALQRLLATIAPYAAHWDEFLAEVDAIRGVE